MKKNEMELTRESYRKAKWHQLSIVIAYSDDMLRESNTMEELTLHQLRTPSLKSSALVEDQ